jgi:hypothetical protein
MDSGTKVYRAYVATTPGQYWFDEGTVSEIVMDGVPLVRWHDSLVPLTDRWHATKAGASGVVVAELAKQIGALQAKLDTLRDEMLHESLTTDEAQVTV